MKKTLRSCIHDAKLVPKENVQTGDEMNELPYIDYNNNNVLVPACITVIRCFQTPKTQ